MIEVRTCGLCDWYVASCGECEIEAGCPWWAAYLVVGMVRSKEAKR